MPSYIAGLRCKLRIHKWKGYHDGGDGINLSPISGYRKPHGVYDFRKCNWCGETNGVYRSGDDRIRVLLWSKNRMKGNQL